MATKRGIHNTYRALERAMNPQSVVDQRLKKLFSPISCFKCDSYFR